MRHRSIFLPLLIIFLVLSLANAGLTILIASHLALTPIEERLLQASAFLFFALQMIAPCIQMFTRKGFSPNKFWEILNWYSCVALGALSTMVVTAVALELPLAIAIQFYPKLQTHSLFHVIWIAVFGTIAFATLTIGVAQANVGPKIKKVHVPIQGLPKSFDGYRIVQISDLHVSALIGRRYTQKVVNTINSLDADIVALTGDFVDGSVDQLRYRIAPLADIKHKDGRYFVTGNHEYYHDALEWIDEHRRLGNQVLLNEHKLISRGDDKIAVAGTIDRAGKYFIKEHKEDISKAIEGLEPEIIKVLLAHHPNCHDEAAAKGIHLQLSGHTHGGQFFPWQAIVRLVHTHYNGLSKQRSMWIYVNPGTGFWGPPIRTTIPAEVTLLILKAVA